MEEKDLFAINLAGNSINASPEEVFGRMVERIAMDIYEFKVTYTRPIEGYIISQVNAFVGRIKNCGYNYNLDCLNKTIAIAEKSDTKLVSVINEALDEDKSIINLNQAISV